MQYRCKNKNCNSLLQPGYSFCSETCEKIYELNKKRVKDAQNKKITLNKKIFVEMKSIKRFFFNI